MTGRGSWHWVLVVVPGGLIGLGAWRAWKAKQQHRAVAAYLSDPGRPQ